MISWRSSQELPAELRALFGGGPHFDLSIELGPTGDNTRVNAALARLWTCINIDGPYHGRISQKGPECEFGALKMGDAAPPLPFIVHWIQERRASEEDLAEPIQFGIQTQEPSDWLTLGIPVGALRSLWPVDYSWRVATQPWLLPLCSALADVADHIYAAAPFPVGVMGEEASGCWRRPTPARARESHQAYPPLAVLDTAAIEERGGFVLAPAVWAELAPGANPITLPSGLLYASPQPKAALTGA